VNDQLKDAKKRVQKSVDKFEKKLGIGSWWKIKHVFSELPDGATVMPADGLMPTAARTTACTMTQWQYRTAEITWYLPSVAQISDKKLDWVTVHEFVHILNAPMATFLFDYLRDDEAAVEQIRTIGQYSRLEEFVTENLCRVIMLALGEDVPA
jgi:hypothetical protein